MTAACFLPVLGGAGGRAAQLGVAGALALAIFVLATVLEMYRRR